MLWQQEINHFHHQCESYWLTLFHVSDMAPEVTAMGSSGWIQDSPITEDFDIWQRLSIWVQTHWGWMGYTPTSQSQQDYMQDHIQKQQCAGNLNLDLRKLTAPNIALPLAFLVLSLCPCTSPSVSHTLFLWLSFALPMLINERTLGSFMSWKINDLIWQNWLLGLKTKVLTP